MKTFTLPLPETTNHAYATHQGRWYKTSKQKTWEEEAGYVIMISHGKNPPIKEDISVSIRLFLKRDRDIDGSIKPILDLFQRMNVYKNDRQVTQLDVWKFKDKKNPRAEVNINEI